jgi:cob(I)alamin adenosyltransferase
MKIYTKTGDKGTTSLISGRRVSKANLRIESYGTVDELNSYIGMLRDQKELAHRKEILIEIQDRLFTIGSLLASDPKKASHIPIPQIDETDITDLEVAIDVMNEELPPMTHFILPGGHQAVSFCHLARTVCRRAERRCIELHTSEDEQIDEIIIRYMNRLSDYIFVLSRMTSHEVKADEIAWKARV